MGRGRGRGGRGGGRERAPPKVCEEEEEYLRQLGGQDPRAGRMPSESDSSDSDPDSRIGPVSQDNVFSRGRGQSSNVGMLPPSDSESDSDSDNGDGAAAPPQKAPPRAIHAEEPAKIRRDPEDGPDEEQMARDMERLKLIRDKREKERQQRIAKEGWDRFAPVTETNKPPTGAGRPDDE